MWQAQNVSAHSIPTSIGSGLAQTQRVGHFVPSETRQQVPYLLPNADDLVARLDLLMASKSAGNTGVNDEILYILNHLKSQNIIDNDLYKKMLL